MRLAGKTALVSGAGSGIGRALAIEASRRGMAVALVGRRVAKLNETEAFLAPGTECLVLAGDITSPVGRRSLVDRIGERWGRLHVLVNNAGIVAAGPLAATVDRDLDRLMATNVIAPIALTRDMLPLLRAAAPARVVNIGSMLGDIPLPMFAAYSASKFALRGLSGALRRELKCLGIGVTHASPRGARTGASAAIARYVAPQSGGLDSPDAIARQVWEAVARERDHAYPHGREGFLMLVERLFPSLIDRATRLKSADRAIDDGAGGESRPHKDFAV